MSSVMSQANTKKPNSMLSVWWKAIRPATLWAGAAPIFVGAGLAAQTEIEWNFLTIFTLFMALIGALLIQIGCNLVNDYADFERGTDDEHRLGPARAAAQGWLTARELKRGALVSLALAGLCGVYLTWIGGLPILCLGLASLVCAVAYTAGPFPLAYLGLGDLFVLLFFGLGAVGGTTWLLCADLLPWTTWFAGLSVGGLATAILVVNNLRDRQGDARNQKNTLVVRFGATFARWEYSLLVSFAFLTCLSLGIIESSWGWSLPLVLLPLAFKRMYQVWSQDGRSLNPLLGATAQLELLYCLLLGLGLIIEASWR